MRFRIVSWNINSVRLRLPLARHLLTTVMPDVLCLQETKCQNTEFPVADFEQLGYPHVAIHGQKAYHGVAILSRLPFHEVNRRDFCGKGDARHVSVRFDATSGAAAGLIVHNFYVPAGGDEPDPAVNPKFAHKLAFLDEMADWTFKEDIGRDRAVLVGDLNIAPLETDVWNHKALLKVVSHTPIEVEKMNRLLSAGSWIDGMRRIVPETEKLYTWWSYRSPNWDIADKGRRLDHVWLSPPLGAAMTGLQVLREARGWERASDHVPVIADLDL